MIPVAGEHGSPEDLRRSIWDVSPSASQLRDSGNPQMMTDGPGGEVEYALDVDMDSKCDVRVGTGVSRSQRG